jgi:hypothetical protein
MRPFTMSPRIKSPQASQSGQALTIRGSSGASTGAQGARPTDRDLSHIEAGLLALAVPIGKVSEDPANVREHPEQNLEALKASIRRFGQQRPVLVDQDCVVVTGNDTLRAMRDH